MAMSIQNKRLLAVAASINIMSLLDAASTLFLISNNYSVETNPVMSALIQRSYILFVIVKIATTLGATLVCCYYYSRRKRARTILNVGLGGYAVLMAYHGLLLSSEIIVKLF
jgi:hypothetical protein